MRQFLDHPQTVEIAFGRMMQDVKPDEAGKKVLVSMPHLVQMPRLVQARQLPKGG